VDPASARAVSPLAQHLRRRIAREGPLTLARFMEEALGNPAFGYYMTRDPFGAAGDFVTAPEISQMFGELIGLWCGAVWQAMGEPRPVCLVELGPGRGTLMADALRALGKVPGFHEAVRVHLVERSPLLRARQRAAMAASGLARPPAWLNDFSQVPREPALVVANEFFDAMPIRQFERAADGWRERLVDAGDSGFRFVHSPPLARPHLIPEHLREAPEGSVVEVSPAGLRAAHTIADRLRRLPGAALVIDYGHAESAAGDTLQAVRAHAFADPLACPGEADLTAHVDFAALKRVAEAAGARVEGPLAQGDFLERLGIRLRERALLAAATPEQARLICTATRRLVDRDRMGSLFKVLGLAHPALPPLPGFAG
jgi:NADH dehydrogenase [ubiquinone] 1 alpha subcomplex assembly factor 7